MPTVIAAAALLAGAAAGACGTAEAPPPAADVSLVLNKTRVPLGGPIDFTYKFAPGRAIDGDYRVFAHVVAADGTIMWNDDHDPPTPTSAWRPGTPIEYTHSLFVPLFPYLGEATVRVGLYRGDERLPLSAAGASAADADERAYTVGTLQLLPQAESVFLIYGSGWHPAEYSTEDPTRGWQWTDKSASVTFRNPRQDVTLFFDYDARPDAFPDAPQTISIFAGARAVATFAADNTDPVLRRIPIAAADLGTGDMAEIRVVVDKTFAPAGIQPGSSDIRDLGVRVYHVYVEPR
jgi:hypothetical protein